MDKYYTIEKHTQILIALLKAHNIKKIIVSPGTTNMTFVASIQQDPYFELYSSVDERSAAYIACGLAAESGESVALSCTGATASRNYIPGLTEAYYRQLPVLVITSSQHLGRIEQYIPQVINRSQPLADIVKESVTINCVYSEEDKWASAVNINKALLALKKDGGGPAHINLVTTYSQDYSCKILPKVKKISLVENTEDMPPLDEYKRIAILVGVHERWTENLSQAIEDFCSAYDAVVIMNHASNYKGAYGYDPNLINNMKNYYATTPLADLVIYIGSASRYGSGMREKEMWRVNPDGKIRDFEKKLTYVFAMNEADFFRYYADLKKGEEDKNNYAKQWQREYNQIIMKIPDLPFSNVWIAKTLSPLLPDGSVLHLAGSNTARAWNFFQIPKSVECYSNDGTMGIDGQVSSLVGESLANPNRIHFGAVGDLTFFYDMNVLGNRHVGKNLRLLIVNNGKGAEFKLYTHSAYEFGEKADKYIAAKGHFGNMSKSLVRHYAEDLGYEYLSATTKTEFIKNVKHFTVSEMTEKPMIFEVFTDSHNESEAIYIMNHLISNSSGKVKDFAKNIITRVAGENGMSVAKNFFNK